MLKFLRANFPPALWYINKVYDILNADPRNKEMVILHQVCFVILPLKSYFFISPESPLLLSSSWRKFPFGGNSDMAMVDVVALK